MKLPKKINICGKPYTVRLDPNRADGEGDLIKKIITVGGASKGDIPEIFLHEVLEAILFERGHRYASYAEGNDGLRFVMSHHDFENVVKDLSGAISIYLSLCNR